MKAAVLRAYNTPLEIEDVTLGNPGPREVRVQTKASGVCHSDLHVIEGARQRAGSSASALSGSRTWDRRT
jgi:S-(hydroxymethyl)glutathione dehydrogenase/alcohol dehydrogenase